MTIGLTITGETSRGAVILAYQTESKEVALSSVCTFVGTRISLQKAVPIKKKHYNKTNY